MDQGAFLEGTVTPTEQSGSGVLHQHRRSPRRERDAGKIRQRSWCADCRMEQWGIFMWRRGHGVFVCGHARDEITRTHETLYEFSGSGWVPRSAIAA